MLSRALRQGLRQTGTTNHTAVLALFGSKRDVAISRIRSFIELAARPDADGLRLVA